MNKEASYMDEDTSWTKVSLDLFPRSSKLMVAMKFSTLNIMNVSLKLQLLAHHFANGCRARSAPSVYKKTKINNDDIV